jgi:hypothetical protein
MVASYWCYKLYFGQANQALNPVSSPGNGVTKQMMAGAS